MLPNDSWSARPRARPSAGALPQPAFSAASASTAPWRGLSLSSDMRYASGSWPVAWAASSIVHSIANAVVVLPTERHHRTGIGVLGECSEIRTALVESRYGDSARPSTDVGSRPCLL